jgi:hypothetical protein
MSEGFVSFLTVLLYVLPGVLCILMVLESRSASVALSWILLSAIVLTYAIVLGAKAL